MDAPDWKPLYQRLCTAYGKSPNVEQADVYLEALRGYPRVVVAEAVAEAIKESRGWPSAADLAERARQARRDAPLPVGTCDVCHNETWVILPCAGVTAPDATTRPEPVDRRAYCGRSYVHADHDYAVRCPQCWTTRAAVA